MDICVGVNKVKKRNGTQHSQGGHKHSYLPTYHIGETSEISDYRMIFTSVIINKDLRTTKYKGERERTIRRTQNGRCFFSKKPICKKRKMLCFLFLFLGPLLTVFSHTLLANYIRLQCYVPGIKLWKVF